MTSPQRTLISIGPSHYVEKARWCLDLYKLPYIEERYIPLYHFRRTVPLGRRQTPLLLEQGKKIEESSIICRHIHDNYQLPSQVQSQVCLFPTDPTELSKVMELDELFGKKLGRATRLLVYYHAVESDEILHQTFCTKGTNALDQKLFPVFLPYWKKFMKKTLGLTAQNYSKSIQFIDDIFHQVSQTLETRTFFSQRDRAQPLSKFLVTDKISLADISFAALGAPLINVGAKHGYPLPPEELLRAHLPSDFWQMIDGWRKTPAGQFINSMYEHHRPSSSPTLAFQNKKE
eukprot:TRINITY_DN2398_c0_g3_i4.p1 TRINITY_DN2398_c0_g3~~TRINITY_DN2398_c0_g3_i4.p1  ORF type:complete len:315 (+),score=95.66 TRINITY_DN2398_c0_g3_i4:81-947(+)